jgi:hypothetical protein
MDVEPEQKPRKARKPRVKLLTRLKHRVSDSYTTMRGIVAEPHTAPGIARAALIKLWRVRGGGFYGLGYVITFVVLEIRTLIGTAVDSTDVVTMMVQEALQLLFRFAVQSFINGFVAFGWPIVVVNYLHGWGLLAIGVGWLLFDRWAKPWINARLPELAPEERKKTKRRKRRSKRGEGPAAGSDVVP